MGLINWLKRSFPWSSAQAIFPSFQFWSVPDATEMNVDPLTALCASAVWASVRVISSAVATLDVEIKDIATGEVTPDHPLHELLCYQPNGFMTAATFWESFIVNLLLWGNGYAFIDRDEAGRPIGLYPIPAVNVAPAMVNGQLVYYSQLAGQQYPLRYDQILHVKCMGLDGLVGLSPMQWQRQTVGLSMALEKYFAKYFSSGGLMGGVVTTPPGMSKEAQKAFLDSWKEQYTGTDNAWRLAALPTGYDIKTLTSSVESAQGIEARTFQIQEISRIYGVPLHKLAELTRATFSNIEHQSLEFMGDCVRPYVMKIEQEIRSKCLLEVEKKAFRVEFDISSILRRDLESQFNALSIGVNGRLITTNEARKQIGYQPIEGGDKLLEPLNMKEAGVSRSLIEDGLSRLGTKEVKAIQRAMDKHKDAAEFKAWATDFYNSHQKLVCSTMADPLALIQRSSTEFGKVANAHLFAKEYAAESLQKLVAAHGAGTVEALLDEWESVRPFQVTDRLMRG